MTFKYVMFDESLPVLFGDYLNHDDIKVAGKKPTSAGRVSVSSDGSATTFGQSIGLRMKPNEGDASIIERLTKNEI